MAKASIPVDLRNPGQVFACLGLMEAAEILCGPAVGEFSRTDRDLFHLETPGGDNPIPKILEFLTSTKVRRVVPKGWADPPNKSRKADNKSREKFRNENDTHVDIEDISDKVETTCFPSPAGDLLSLPVRLGGGNLPELSLGHWADGTSRESFKLYSGNRSAAKIVTDMCGYLQTQKKDHPEALMNDPFGILCPMKGSFNMDHRGAWTSRNIGYSPNRHKQRVLSSPAVELLAVLGLQHSRPTCMDQESRIYRYAIWSTSLCTTMARVVFTGVLPVIPCKFFTFQLDLSGKNKIVTQAEEDPAHD